MPSQQHNSEKTALFLLLTLAFCHLLNDVMQSLIPAIYPLLKNSFHLTFFQVGLITLTVQVVGSILQPIIGFYTDRYPKPFALALGMGFSLGGIILLALAGSYTYVLIAAGLIGMGAAIFHPEGSRIAHMASGGKHGLAQSIFQLGGNTGTSLGPLLAALFIVPYGRIQMLWFGLLAFLGIIILTNVGHWFRRNTHRLASKSAAKKNYQPIPRARLYLALTVLITLVFSKFFYLSSMMSYYTFFLMSKFHLSISHAQYFLFLFLFSTALGTIIGGPLGDRFGRKKIIWVSILGAAPFSILLPYVSLFWMAILTVIIGIIIASAFSAILIYAQELLPGNVGMLSGLFFGLAFGAAGLGAVLLGALADKTSISFVFTVCSFLPLIGLLTGLLPNVSIRQSTE
ncbi:MAG: Fosmidomycin resistance protein [Verrucomicrobia bacterium RIFCSPHIGHO2_12_FULL_41_10]|nr:MAG: Fosmidomycin resistance protein [Verrucomicrobia bacterium RIFCSPHIGHO2_12_FULL_41_10]HLB33640.1 MFS transporter [Chthoniobacterales bacterium]